MTARDITFSIKAEYLDESDRAFDALEKRGAAAHKRLTDQAVASARAAADAMLKATQATPRIARPLAGEAKAGASAGDDRAAAKASAAKIAAAEQTADAIDKLREQELRDIGKEAEYNIRHAEKVAASKVSSANRSAAEETKLREQAMRDAAKEAEYDIAQREKAYAAAIAAAKRAAAAEEKEAERLHKRHRQRQRSIAQQNRKAAAEQLKEGEAHAKAIEKALAAEAKARDDQQKKILRAEKRASDQRQKELKTEVEHNIRIRAQEGRRLQRIEAMSLARVQQLKDARGEALSGLTESVSRAARGFAQLGILSDGTSEQILRNWIKVQAGFDVLAGGINTVIRVSKGLRLLTEISETVATGQAAANKAAQMGITAANAQSAALVQEAAAAQSASAAHLQLAAARSNPNGVGGVIGGGDGGSDAVDSLGRGAAATGGGMAAGGSAIAVAGAAIAAAAAVGAALLTLKDSILGVAESGVRGGVKVDSFTDRIAVAEVKAASFLDSAAQSIGGVAGDAGTAFASILPFGAQINDTMQSVATYTKTTEAAERAEQRLIEAKRRSIEQEERNARQEETRRSLRVVGVSGIEDRNRLALAGASGDNRAEVEQQNIGRLASEARNELTAAAEQARLIGHFGTDEARIRAAKRLAEAHDTVAKIEQERLGLARQVSEVQKEASRERIRGLQDEVAKAREAGKAAAERLMTAAERFGAASEEEQKKILAARQQVKAAEEGGAADPQAQQERADLANIQRRRQMGIVRPEDRQREEEIRATRQQRGAASLTREQENLLSGVGTQREQEQVRASRIQRAERAGFSGAFGDSERRDIARSQERERELQVKLKDERKLSVTIERDENALIGQALNAIRSHLERRDAALLDTIRREFARDTAQIAQRNNEQLNARAS